LIEREKGLSVLLGPDAIAATQSVDGLIMALEQALKARE